MRVAKLSSFPKHQQASGWLRRLTRSLCNSYKQTCDDGGGGADFVTATELPITSPIARSDARELGHKVAGADMADMAATATAVHRKGANGSLRDTARSSGTQTPSLTNTNGAVPSNQPLTPRPSSRHSKYKHTFPVHSYARTSPLSHDAANPPSFFGFRNLMGLVLVVSNLRLMIENFKKYGILVTLSGAAIRRGDWTWFGVLYIITPCFLFVAYAIEALAAQYAKGKV
ncbi:hypothetical protein KC346_g22833, partial [Hortaea werneckii]